MAARRVLSGLCAALLAGGCSLTAPRGSDGWADLDSLGVTDVDNVFTLSIGPGLLKLAANAVDDDPETRELLRNLDGVRVRVYEIDGDFGRVAARAERMQRRLQGDDWEPVAVVQEAGERTFLMVKSVDGRICGLLVISADHDEAVIVNVMGELRPDQFGTTMAVLDVGAPQLQVADSR